MQTASGKIAVVQESRFRLVTDADHWLLLTLGHSAGVTSDDLRRWQAEGTRVIVRFEGTSNLEDAVAHRVHPEQKIA